MVDLVKNQKDVSENIRLWPDVQFSLLGSRKKLLKNLELRKWAC
jgi:hypothetical protein